MKRCRMGYEGGGMFVGGFIIRVGIGYGVWVGGIGYGLCGEGFRSSTEVEDGVWSSKP